MPGYLVCFPVTPIRTPSFLKCLCNFSALTFPTTIYLYSPMPRLGNSASQVGGSTIDYGHLLGVVTQLQQQLEVAAKPAEALRSVEPSCKVAPEAEENLDGSELGSEAAVDSDTERMAEVEAMDEAIESAESEIQEEKKRRGGKARPIATPARAPHVPNEHWDDDDYKWNYGDDDWNVYDSKWSWWDDEGYEGCGDEEMAECPPPDEPKPAHPPVVELPAAAVNSSTHKKEYMRLEL